jgi:hypothetical protein
MQSLEKTEEDFETQIVFFCLGFHEFWENDAQEIL